MAGGTQGTAGEDNALTRLFHQVEGQVTDISAAESAARVEGAAARIPAELLYVSSAVARKRAVECGEWARALPLARLVLAYADGAAEATDDSEYVQARIVAALDIVEIAHLGLGERGDVRLWELGTRAGEEALTQAQALGRTDLVAVALHRLGTLCTDPWIAGRSAGGYAIGQREWLDRARLLDDPDLLLGYFSVSYRDGSDADMPRLPKPVEALRRGEDYLRRALPLVSDARRPYTRKALAQALLWLGLLGERTDRDEVAALCRDALSGLPREHVEARLRASEMLAYVDGAGLPSGEEPDPAELVRDLEGLVRDRGERGAWEALEAAAGVLQHRDPAEALRVLLQCRGLPEPWRNESARCRHFEFELSLLARTESSTVGRWRRWFRTIGDGPRSRAVRHLAACLERMRADQDTEGLRLLGIAMVEDPTLAAEHAAAFSYLAAGLVRGQGVNAVREQRWQEALEHYLVAAADFLDQGLLQKAVTTLELVHDVVQHTPDLNLNELSAWLSLNALRLETVTQGRATRVIQDLGRDTVARAVSSASGTSYALVHALFQGAKGRRFAAWLTLAPPVLVLDERARHQLDLVADLEADLPAGSSPLRPPSPEALLREDDLLVGYIDVPRASTVAYRRGQGDQRPAVFRGVRHVAARRGGTVRRGGSRAATA